MSNDTVPIEWRDKWRDRAVKAEARIIELETELKASRDEFAKDIKVIEEQAARIAFLESCRENLLESANTQAMRAEDAERENTALSERNVGLEDSREKLIEQVKRSSSRITELEENKEWYVAAIRDYRTENYRLRGALTAIAHDFISKPDAWQAAHDMIRVARDALKNPSIGRSIDQTAPAVNRECATCCQHSWIQQLRPDGVPLTCELCGKVATGEDTNVR